MQDKTSGNIEKNNPNFQGIDPARLSIRMSLKNSFLFPCATCGSILTRLPFEVVDHSGRPICNECCKRINHSLSMLLDFYYREMGHYTFNLASASGNQYHGSWGMIKIYERPAQRILDFIQGMIDISDKLGIEQFFYNNLSCERFEGMAALKATNKALWEHIERTTKEFMDEHPDVGSEVKYFLIINTEKAMLARMSVVNMTKVFDNLKSEADSEDNPNDTSEPQE